jgi:restriction system protein
VNKVKFIDGKTLSLEKFIQILLTGYPLLAPNNHFPTDDLLNEFLSTIKQRSDTEVKDILRALFIKNCTFKIDLIYKETYQGIDVTKDKELATYYDNFSQTQYFKRLMSHKKDTDTVWEGLTWIIDLLPHFPNEALRGLDAYFLANCQFLPDSYFNAFGDWSAIIRAKYIDIEVPQDIFLGFQPKEFEYLIAELYEKLGYETKLTKTSYDGGVDIIAEKKKTGKKEKLLIQCKRYQYKIGVDEIRKLLGVLSDQKATKGTLITCSDYTREARRLEKSNPRIELINISDLTRLLNLHLGPLWHVKADGYFMKQKKKFI